MSFKRSEILLSFLMIPIVFLGIFGNWAWAQSDDASPVRNSIPTRNVSVGDEAGISDGVDISVELSLRDLKEVDRRLQDYELLKEIDKAKDDRISNLEKDLTRAQKELDLEKRENDINQRMIALQQREIDLQKQTFDQMKEVAEKAIKLSEQGKKSTASEILEWVIRIALFAAGVFAAK